MENLPNPGSKGRACEQMTSAAMRPHDHAPPTPVSVAVEPRVGPCDRVAPAREEWIALGTATRTPSSRAAKALAHQTWSDWSGT